jgi:predicted DNA-binding transcriptional regulator AlpA
MDTTTPHSTPSEIMTREEAAAYLKLSRHTLDSWARQDMGPPYSRTGETRGRTFYERREIDRWLEQRRVNRQGGQRA